MKKRLISLLLVVTMVLSLLPVSAMAAQTGESTTTVSAAGTTNPFVDVKKTDWFYDAVQYARANGFFSGTSATTFDPEGTMTRGMFVTVLGHMAGVDAEQYKGASAFEDVPEDAWYAPFVAWAAKHGITAGTGEGKFSPDAFINREQMATLFVNYFKAFDVEYKTDANITTTPADVDSISGWAKEAALKLWSTGLMVGNGVSFNPQGSASRAQAAALCKNTDQAVAVWYKEPGVASDRVSVDPETVEPEQPEQPEQPEESEESQNPGSSNRPVVRPSGTYKVTFSMGAGQSNDGVTMPENKNYPKNTKISELPTPFKANSIFVGWYYDAAMTQAVESNATLSKNTTLYAKMAASEQIVEQELANFATITVEADRVSSFDFVLKATEAGGSVTDAIDSFILVSEGNAKLTVDADDPNYKYTVSSNGTVSAPFKQGQNYLVKLKEDAKVVFVVDGETQGEAIRTLSIITEKDEVQNLALSNGMKYLPFTSVGNMTGTALDGLFNVNTGTRSGMQQNKNEGTFTYAGGTDFYGNTLQLGDTVAIYEGTVPNQRDATNASRASQIGNEGAVAYVEIYKFDKDTNTYYYRTADTQDVLFTPDVLPFTLASDQDSADHQITVDTALLDFSAQSYQQMGLNLNADTVAEPGDYIVLYTQWGAGEVVYGCITDVTENDDTTVIKYTDAQQEDVLASMDIYASRNEKLELTDEEKDKIEDDIKQQALESGFLDEAAEYLTALAVETNGFQELSEDLDMDLSSYSITFDDGTPVDPDSMELMAGLKASIEDKSVDVNVMAGDLTHFMDGEVPLSGLRAELVMKFSVSFKSGDKEKMKLEMQAIFEQELLLSINVSGGAIWEWAWIVPYLYDYNLNANLDVGTYTGIGITATIQTVGEEEEEEGDDDKEDDKDDDKKDDNKSPFDDFDWHEIVDVTSTKLNEIDEAIGKVKSAKDRIMNIGDEIKELMESEQELFRMPNKAIIGDGESAGTVEFKSLEERYADMMEEAEESWIKIFEVKIFESSGFVDPFHILCYGINADFIVSANLYITMGMTFEYEVAKRYNFSLMLFHGKVTSETIDLATEHYQFDFYVMGTAGIRAGIEFEIEMGLFSLELDSVGISAELGAYAQLWGYFYYHLEWEKGQGKQSNYSGALAIEIGAYLSVKFKAQALSMDKLTYNPTLFEDEFPILTVGSIENIRDFNYAEDDDLLAVEMKTVKSVELPTELFEMAYMDMKTGELHGGEDDDEPINYDDDKESRFIIELSNPKFSYDPATNTITADVDPELETSAHCEMTITWGGAPLAFTSDSISRTVSIEWMNPAGVRTISFSSNGGTPVPAIVLGWGNPIYKFTAPEGEAVHYKADPVRQGYDFLGWYHAATGDKFEIPDEMPNYEKDPQWGRGVVVYAKWKARNDTPYTLYHYVEQPSGRFDLVKTTTHQGTTMTEPTKAEIEAIAAANYDDEYHYLGAYQTYAIAADGSMSMKLYYRRETFSITFEFGDAVKGIPVGNTEPIVLSGKYGTKVVVPTLKFEGFKFNGFTHVEGPDPEFETVTQLDGATYYTVEIQGNAKYRAKWQPGDNVAFRVEHWVKKAGGLFPTYELAENGIEYKFGTTREKVAPGTYAAQFLEGKEGFKVRENEPYRVEAYGLNTYDDMTQWKIAADGSTVVKIYYDRNFYDVLFVWPNGRVLMEDVEYGTAIPKPMENYQFIDPSVPGKTFAGWYAKDENGELEKKIETEKDLLDLSLLSQVTHDTLTLTAKYNVNRYTISYNMDGGALPEGVTNPTSYNVESGTITLNAPVKEGYTFMGWVGDGVPASSPQKEVTVPVNLAKDLSYTATWSINEYTITFNTDGGTEMAPLTLKYNAVVTVTNPTKDGYDFAGWEPALPGAMPATDLAVTAKWVERGYKITFNSYGGSAVEELIVGFGKPIPQLPTPTREGYDFVGWTGWENGVEPDTMPRQDVKLTAEWTPKMYTITFDSNGGTSVGSITAAYDTMYTKPAAPTREGYTFTGWNPELPVFMPLGGLNVTATWKLNEHTLTFDPGYAGAQPITKTVAYGASIKDLPELADRKGYKFLGWEAVPSTMPDKDVTVTAQWDPWKMTVKFHANVPAGMESRLTGTMADQIVAYGQDNTLRANTFALPGTSYSPINWKTSPTGGEGFYHLQGAVPNEAIQDGAVLNLYLQWATGKAPYTVKAYVQNLDGSWPAAPYETKEYSDTPGKTLDAENFLYSFPNRDHFELDRTKGVPTGEVAADGSLVLEAYWAREVYTVTWEYNGVVQKVEEVLYGNAPVYGGETPTIEEVDYVYTFRYWFDITHSTEVGEGYIVYDDILLRASFNKTERQYVVTWDANGGRGTVQTYPMGYSSGSWRIPEQQEVIKDQTSQYSYTLSHWNSKPDGTGVDLVDENGQYIIYKGTVPKEFRTVETWYAQWTATVREYLISWVVNGKVVYEGQVPYGTMPVYNGPTPTKEYSNGYYYVWNGDWTPEVSEVTRPMSYTARFDSIPEIYITWRYGQNGAQTSSDKIPAGTTPTPPEIPTTWKDDAYIYTFERWNPAVTAVNTDTEYQAVYQKSPRAFALTFYSENGEVIGTVPVHYGDTAADLAGKLPQIPAKAEDTFYTYEAKPWTVQTVTGNAEYYASYQAIPKEFTITWKNYDGTTLGTSQVPYGEKPEYTGETPTHSDPIYIFAGWDPDVTKVTGNATYTAFFTKSNAKVTITWDAGGGTLVDPVSGAPIDGSFEYTVGDTIDVIPHCWTAPTMEDYERGYWSEYELAGWTTIPGSTEVAEIGTALRDVTYYPVWEEEIRYYGVWIGWYGGQLTSENINGAFGPNDEATYDPVTKTLTITDLDYYSSMEVTVDGTCYAANIVIVEPGIVENIVFKGDSVLHAYGSADAVESAIFSVDPITIKGDGNVEMRGSSGYAIIAESVKVSGRFTGTLDAMGGSGVQIADGVFKIEEGLQVQVYTDYIRSGANYGSGVGDPIELEVPFSGNLSDYKKLVITPVAD